MNTLIRQNASTPAEIQNVFQQYIREEQMKKIFKTYFDSEQVDSFFHTMLRMYSLEIMEKFTRYHMYETLQSFSNMTEMWISWDLLGCPGVL